MARIEGVSRSQAGLVVKLVYRFGPGMMKKMTGRAPEEARCPQALPRLRAGRAAHGSAG